MHENGSRFTRQKISKKCRTPIQELKYSSILHFKPSSNPLMKKLNALLNNEFVTKKINE
jgi:hypothetical protein